MDLVGEAALLPTAEPAGGAGESNYAIYGKLYPQVSSYDYKDATRAGTTGGSTLVDPPSATADHSQRSTLDVSNSRIGFRGSEALGGGLSAIFQIETRVRFDTGAGNVWAGGRNSFIGLTGSRMGTVKLGNMDTAYKEVGDPLGMLGISSGNFVSTSGVLSQGPTSDSISFHERRPNAIMYESPEFFGIQLLATWGKDETKGNPGNGTNQLLNSYAIKYEMGPIYLAFAREIWHDQFMGSNSFTAVSNPTDGADVRSNDSATRFAAMYKIGQTSVALDLAQVELKESGVIAAGNFKNYKNKRMAVVVEQKFGPWTGAASVANSDEGTCTLEGSAPCSTAGLEGRTLNFGVSYSFSRRTQAFAIFSQLKNGQSATYDTTAINPAGGSAPQQGEDVTAIGVGVSHSF
jgi:predicted porin